LTQKTVDRAFKGLSIDVCLIEIGEHGPKLFKFEEGSSELFWNFPIDEPRRQVFLLKIIIFKKMKILPPVLRPVKPLLTT
jgi:hypothetical protein